MKNITFKIVLPCIAILTGCSTVPPRNATDKIDDNTNSFTQKEKTLKQQPPSSSTRIYPYQITPAIKPVPITIALESSTVAKDKIDKTTLKNKTPIAKPNNINVTATRKANPITTKSNVKKNRNPSIALITPTKPQPTITQPVTPIAALLQQAENQHAAGDLVKAAATLERGVRIEPRNPRLWNRLARIRLEQGLFSQAHSMATKSNTMAGSSTQLIQENQNIITEASKRAGH